MIDQEAIQQELDKTVRAAHVAMESFRVMFIAKLETHRPFGPYDLAMYLSCETENMLADWIIEAMDFGRSTPEETLREVRGKATNAIFKGERTSDPLLKAMNEHRKNSYTSFLHLTEHLLGNEPPEERRASNQFTLDTVTENVRRRYESAVHGNHQVLMAAHAETLFTLTTGNERHQVTNEEYEDFVNSLWVNVVAKNTENGRA